MVCFLSKLASSKARAVAVVGFCFFLVGCGDGGPPRYELSGQVTYNGKPIPAGIIYFEPTGMVANKSTIGEAAIKSGRYKTTPERGTVGGLHSVTIVGYNGVPEPGSGPMGATIFRPYKVSVELPEEPSTHNFQVPALGQSKSRR